MKHSFFLLIWICLASCLVTPSSALATQPLPKEFEEIYENILNNPDFVNQGNPKGKYVIIDFFDYRCTFCEALHKKLAALVKSKEGKNIRWISIETPVFGYKYNNMSNFILASKEQNKYKELFYHIAKNGNQALSEVKKLGKKLGFDGQKLEEDATSIDFIPTYRKHLKIYKIFGTTAVPVLILNKQYQVGGLKEGQLEQIIKDANPPRPWASPFIRFF